MFRIGMIHPCPIERNGCRVDNMYYRQLFDYNHKLVDGILDLVKPRSFERFIEFGSGSGLFTLPLMERVYDLVGEYLIVDPFQGPYAKDKVILNRRITESGYTRKVKIVQIPIWEAYKELDDADIVVGHDVFCDLSIEQVRKTLRSGRKMLKEDGLFIHSGLSPTARTKAERLLLKLDSFSTSTFVSDNWFSPGSEFLYAISVEAGFENVKVEDLKIPLSLMGSNMKTLIKEWRINEKALEKYRTEINEVGIEYPKEQVLICR